MSAEAAAGRGGLAKWCGWIVAGGLVLVPLLGWLGPQGFAVLLGLMGLFGLPALLIEDEDRPAAVVLLAALIWTAMSSAWSPYHPSKPGNNSALKLAFELPLYWAALCAARRADIRLKVLALQVFAWGVALFGLILLAEVALDAGLYERLHIAFYEPIRHDLAQVKVAHSSFVLALLWPLAVAAALKARMTPWIVLPAAAGAMAAAVRFGADAPAIAVVLGTAMGLATWRWPSGAPKALAVAAVVYWIAAPGVVLAVRATGDYGMIANAVPLSWAERMGYWSHAVDWIRDHPLRGWGLDASRMFGPGIVLHPHDDALQVWLELGAMGAALAAAFWWLALRRLARPESDVGAAAVAASASVYLLFGALNFGVWQEWWLGLGALVAVVGGLMLGPSERRPST